MKKEEFMKELEYLLQDIKEEEKESALAYYRDYLEEAGPENEEKAIEDFGSPERVAAIIRAGINGTIEEGGEFTESGYADERFRDPNYQLQKRVDLWEKGKEKDQEEDGEKSQWENRKKGLGKWLEGLSPVMRFILILFCILLLGVPLLKMGTTALSVIAWTAVGLCIFFLCIGIGAICSILGGLACFIFGVVVIFGEFFEGLLLIGLGLIGTGIGCFAMILALWFYGTVVPWLFRKAKELANRLICGERRQKA